MAIDRSNPDPGDLKNQRLGKSNTPILIGFIDTANVPGWILLPHDAACPFLLSSSQVANDAGLPVNFAETSIPNRTLACAARTSRQSPRIR